MINVLFVCLGNICRSPMAEAILRDLIKKDNLEKQITVDSAGTGSWHIGDPPHRGTREILKKNKINAEGLIARKVESRDLDEFDYTVAMDASNKESLEAMKANLPKGKVTVLLDYVPEIADKNVPDPYFTGNFSEVFRLVEEGCNKLYERIKADHFNN